MTKTFKKTLFLKNNDFCYPKLELSNVFVLEAWVCSVKWMRDLHHENKDKIISNHRMPKNDACDDNLNKQKVPLP